jgi:hypothetical protein
VFPPSVRTLISISAIFTILYRNISTGVGSGEEEEGEEEEEVL